MEKKDMEEEDTAFLFDISKEIKHIYETPVIFLTKKDYFENLFHAMCTIRSALQTDSKNRIIDVIVDYHLQWLHAVNEIENFKKRINDLPKEEMYQCISYTIDAMSHRLKYYQKYMDMNRPMLSNLDQANVIADLEIVEDMHKEVTVYLLEKLKCFRNYDSNNDFILKVKEAVDELLNWLDKINDEVSIQLTRYINMNVPHLTGDLTKTLRQIVDELKNSDTPSGHKMLEDLKRKGRELETMIRSTAGHSLEISKVVEKINVLEERIKRLEGETTSAAVMALKHKKEYLEKRLNSLENLKTSLKSIHNLADLRLDVSEQDLCACEDYYQLRIFNHFLPPEDRERLVTELCYLWDLAVFGDRSHKSIISILSAADIKEEYTDDLGTFYIDEHSRKIYRIPEDSTLYQPNEHNELVPISDDSEHIYFYDECGRYFVDAKNRQRVYKAHATASEYMMDSSGILLKIKEERDGVLYHYDNCGRYYVNKEGKNIYREENALSEYENDGLGNLVRIRSHLDIFQQCPDDVHVTEDFKYLKQTVGTALRECIADVIIHNPADPIKYLSLRLMKFRENMELREKRSRKKEQLNIEREIKSAEERAAVERAALEAALLAQGGSETSYDSNLLKYTSLHQDDAMSLGASSK